MYRCGLGFSLRTAPSSGLLHTQKLELNIAYKEIKDGIK